MARLFLNGDRLTTLSSKVTSGADGTVQVVPVAGGTPQVIALKDVAKINPLPVKWTGSFVANAMITTGNSETENFGVSLNAVRRSEIDRITLAGAYYYGRPEDKDTGKKDTTIDNWFILASPTSTCASRSAPAPAISGTRLRPSISPRKRSGVSVRAIQNEGSDDRGSPITWTGRRTRRSSSSTTSNGCRT